MNTAMLDIDLRLPREACPAHVDRSVWTHKLVYEVLEGRVERPLFATSEVGNDRLIRLRVPEGVALGDAQAFFHAATPLPTLSVGDQSNFLLIFNASKRVTGVRNRVAVTDATGVRDAFEAKAAASGFAVIDCRVEVLPPLRIRKTPARPPITQCRAQVTGRLQVTDTGLFDQCLRTGIGAGKAYGLGMLILL
ncbi:type I-E CRISPR-associated protein Cas6/Cse3/CasE [Sinimarinibacterium sp. CAU 1509]|uniref:type I-E CRISPR-associated protein Cas6/Cse3/CasE n=1 Tax=Sinimarinibacterium sp. CAU 1509 TaxID=2562283 RepID=UPI0010AC3273|nr:type I-E CRISPR-associated protein Cas6/Cse3/CasE [Sinimarinibacterium sp. CAU 1509]TJY57240.1 type I-E CRISPR-associated protein Cas6/Cse3/CasE [Sinimarinibacterium sp. CAU 1509]